MNGGNEKFIDDKPVIERSITKIQEVFDIYGYGLVTLRFGIILIMVIMCYGLHLSIYAIMSGPMITIYNLTPMGEQIASGIPFLGLAIGSVLLGLIKESKKHRKLVIVSFSALLTVLHILITFVFNSYVFIIARFFIGACIGIMLPGSYSLLVEYLPIKMRSLTLVFVWLLYPVERIFISGSMLIFMPNFEPEATQTILLIQLVIPALTFILSFILLSDSPRNLIIIGKQEKAYVMLDKLLGRPLKDVEKMNISNEIFFGINHTLEGSFKDMFRSKLLRSTLCLCTIWCIHGLIFYGTLLTSNSTMERLGQATKDKRQIIINQIIIASVLVIPLTLIGVISEFKLLGRIKTLFIAYFLGAAFMVLCPIFSDSFAILYGLSSSFIGAGYTLANSYSSEIYPTKIRESSLSFLYFTSRVTIALSQIVYLYVNEVSLFFPYYLSIGLSGFLLIAIVLLPFETYAKPIDQDFGKKNTEI
jgi:MFS family permease